MNGSYFRVDVKNCLKTEIKLVIVK